MGTTPGGLPYPDGSDPFGEGAQAIQALAEALDPQHAKVARVSTQSFLDSASARVQWTAGSSDLSADFDLVTTSATDDTVKYLGPDRFVVWRYGIKFPGGLVSGTARAQFIRTGAPTTGEDDNVYGDLMDFADWDSNHPFGDSGLVFMETNSEWQIFVTNNTGATRAVSAYASFKAIP